MSLQQYQLCSHCNQLLSDKAIKEHRRLYYDEEHKVWLKVSQGEASSCGSSPFELSPPGSVASSESLSWLSSEDELQFDDNSCDMGKLMSKFVSVC